MDTHDSLTLPEVHVDVSSEGMEIDEASQEGCRPTTDFAIRPTLVCNEKYRSLFQAANKGNWKDVERIFNVDHEAVTAKVMTFGDESITVLDVAVMAAQDELVEKLVNRFHQECKHLIVRALYNAARGGRIRMVKALVNKVDDPESVSLALKVAVLCAPMQKEIIWYLAKTTTSAPDYDTMSCLIMAGHLDICLYLARQYPGLATSKDTEINSLLGDLAKMKSYFRSGATLNIWGKLFYKCIPLCSVNASFHNSKDTKMALAPYIKKIGESKLRHTLCLEFASLALTEKKNRMETAKILEFLLTSGIVIDAASRGISEIVKLCLDHCPQLMWDKNFPKELMQEVVKGRHVELFRLVNAYNMTPYLIGNMLMNNNLMEAIIEWSSPRCVPGDVSAAPSLMQRELQWFKVLADRKDPSFRSLELVEKEEGRERTNWELFVEKRQSLLKEAGQWMKETSSSCSVVATLIVTVTFAAAFTVPGGNDGSTGIPIFLKEGSFIVFAIADALALFSSVSATLMFLAILSTSYAIEDFRHSLPKKMILGLTFLFFSLASMLVAFGSALTILLRERWKQIYIPITLLVALPIVLFTILQLPLYVEMLESTYRPRLYRPLKICNDLSYYWTRTHAM